MYCISDSITVGTVCPNNSIWTPDIVKYNGKYYIYSPANDKIYVVTADAITGPWNDPIDLKIDRVVPDYVVD